MKRILPVLIAASLHLSVPAHYAATASSSGAGPVWPEDAGPTLTLEQLRLQINRLTPQERQQLLRDVAPVFRPGPAGPAGRPGRDVAPIAPNDPWRADRAMRPGQDQDFQRRPGAFAPERPYRGGTSQGSRPGARGFVPDRAAPGGPGGRQDPMAQRPLANPLSQIAGLPPEQRAAGLALMRQRLNNRLAALRQQRESGSLTPGQERQLQNLEANVRRIEELSRLSPRELDAQLNAMRNGAPPRPGFRGTDRPQPEQGARPRRPIQGPSPEATGPEPPRRPFAPAVDDPYGLPPQPQSQPPRPNNAGQPSVSN